MSAKATPLLGLSMIVRDEEANVARLLGPIHDLFDEIVVADTGSSDGTCGTLASLGARVLRVPWEDDFAAARNAALRGVTARWVLWLDADDELSRDHVEALRRLVARSSPTTAYYLELRNVGNRPETSSVCQQLRVFPNLPGIAFEGRIHEQIAPSLARHGVSFGRAPITVLHRGYVEAGLVRQKYERNLRMLRREAEERRNDPFILYHTAQTCTGLGLRDQALEALRALAAVEWPHGVEREMALQARILSARLLEARGDRAGARAALEEALRIEPEHGLARLHLGESLLRSADPSGAARLLEPLVFGNGLAPGVLPFPVEAARETAALLLTQALLDLGRADEAARALSRVPAESLASFGLRFRLGTLRLDAGRFDEAEALLREAHALRPTSAEPLINLGNAAFRRGDAEGATARYREAIEADPRNFLAQENLAKALIACGRSDEALARIEGLVRRDPRRVDLLAHAGDIHLASGRPADAVRAFETLLAAEPRAVATWCRLGDAYRALNAPGAALLGWKKALEIDPGYTPARERIESYAAPAGAATRSQP